MFVSPKYVILSTAFLLGSLPALAAEESAIPAIANAAPAAAVTRCTSENGVPMTRDAEQALPMKLVRTLRCGEGVTVLADKEGYTAHVRSSDGQEGFVARMYLAPGEAYTPKDTPLASASALNGVVRWQAGAPGCDQFASQGRLVETVTSNGITVQVSLQDTGWKLRAEIAISNQSGAAVHVLPTLVTLDELQPSLRSLRELDPAKLAHVVNHQVLRTAANAQPSPSAVVLRSKGAPSFSAVSYHAEYNDYFAEHKAAAADSINPQALALKPGALAPGQKSAGVLWFQRDVNLRELSLRVPAGDLIFDFPLAFKQQK